MAIMILRLVMAALQSGSIFSKLKETSVCIGEWVCVFRAIMHEIKDTFEHANSLKWFMYNNEYNVTYVTFERLKCGSVDTTFFCGY